MEKNRTPINVHTIKVPKDNKLIDEERFFNVEELHVIDKRENMSNNYFNIDDDNKIMNLFLNLPPTAEMNNSIDMQKIHNHQ